MSASKTKGPLIAVGGDKIICRQKTRAAQPIAKTLRLSGLSMHSYSLLHACPVSPPAAVRRQREAPYTPRKQNTFHDFPLCSVRSFNPASVCAVAMFLIRPAVDA